MKADQSASISPQVLSGWKDIANYLGKGVRTVQRYEGEMRLPVRRPAGKRRGSVVATKEELDAWVKASPIREVYDLKSAWSGGNEAKLEEFKHGIEEMRRLRQQMIDLRTELRASVSMLHMSIRSITGYRTRAPRSGVEELFRQVVMDSGNKSPIGLRIAADKRKAS